ncbi:hypothetical protein B7H19_15690 [Pseudomonas putida]|uniref:abortive infection system antitoxin AbiGi family protein n=1 Tax=Pseudomonas putida TaxID=303 RepID=UPI000A110C94|nr:abortive infection system antitoxin AbiGi family protein [Pseudomonas putida]ORL68519.1 hypothetical protein B7H19_15690 [Pseudomonas putida]
MTPKSNALFHFTKSMETLKHILRGGFWPRYCLEDVSWLGYEQYDYVAYPMVCFCEIPLSRISDHVDFYGKFGVGLTRQWAEKNGLNPVFYVSGGNNITGTFRAFNELATIKDNDTLTINLKTVMRELLAFSKPTVGKMFYEEQPVDKVFYQESEWRYVPKHPEVTPYVTRKKHDDEDVRISLNEKTRQHAMLKIAPSDVRYIFVRQDSDIPEVINFIQAELDHHPSADLKVLMSRVVSLESLRYDM